jgi:hypothetical protein
LFILFLLNHIVFFLILLIILALIVFISVLLLVLLCSPEYSRCFSCSYENAQVWQRNISTLMNSATSPLIARLFAGIEATARITAECCNADCRRGLPVEWTETCTTCSSQQCLINKTCMCHAVTSAIGPAILTLCLCCQFLHTNRNDRAAFLNTSLYGTRCCRVTLWSCIWQVIGQESGRTPAFLGGFSWLSSVLEKIYAGLVSVLGHHQFVPDPDQFCRRHSSTTVYCLIWQQCRQTNHTTSSQRCNRSHWMGRSGCRRAAVWLPGTAENRWTQTATTALLLERRQFYKCAFSPEYRYDHLHPR